MRGNYNRPSELLKRQKETGASYWDLIGRPLYDDPVDENDPIYRQMLNEQIDNALERYNCGKSFPGFAGGTEDSYSDVIELLKQFEGFRDYVYSDGNGFPTIGYGFTDPELIKRGKITRKEADARLKKEIIARDRDLQKNIPHWNDLPDSAKNALRSYNYNFPISKGSSPKLLRYLQNRDYSNAALQLDAGYNDKNNPGLRTRRDKERRMFLKDLTEKKQTRQIKVSPGIIPIRMVEQPVQTGIVYRSPASYDPVYTIPSTGQTSSIPAKLDKYYTEKEAMRDYADMIDSASRRLYSNPIDMWENLVGYSRGKSYSFDFWNRNGNVLKPAVRYGRGKD